MYQKGTITFENWKAFLDGEELFQSLTYLLISNSDFEINRNKFGPYSIRKAESKINELSVYYLDIDQYLLFKMIPDDIQTVHNKWHSGTGSEEIAALLLLQFGCKIKSYKFYTFKPAGNWVASPGYLIRPFGSSEKLLSVSSEKP